MNQQKIGVLIMQFRKELGFTQKQLAEKLNISYQAVSKWERGVGSPDISMMTELSDILGIGTDVLLSGDADENEESVNMKKAKFYICPNCGNVITSIHEITASCCGRKLQSIEAVKAEESDRLSVEKIENDYYITSEHEMTKKHYISFVALLTGDKIILVKQFPEWNLQIRIPCIGHGKLVWYCTEHGLMYQNL